MHGVLLVEVADEPLLPPLRLYTARHFPQFSSLCAPVFCNEKSTETRGRCFQV